MFRSRVKGYSISELLFVIWVLFILSMFGTSLWIAIHFIAKYW